MGLKQNALDELPPSKINVPFQPPLSDQVPKAIAYTMFWKHPSNRGMIQSLYHPWESEHFR